MTDPNDVQIDEKWDEGDDEAGDAPSDDAGGAAGGGQEARDKRRAEGGEPYKGDERAEAALAFVADLLDKMDMDCDVELLRPKQDEPNEIQVEIFGRDAGRIIGKKGQVLSALQYLTNRVVNRPGLEKRYVTVDAEGYRARRDDTLATMARRLGKQAVTEGKIITFEPMNPRDRRVIHLALAKFDGVVTKSEGEGEDRRVQIIPVRR